MPDYLVVMEQCVKPGVLNTFLYFIQEGNQPCTGLLQQPAVTLA